MAFFARHPVEAVCDCRVVFIAEPTSTTELATLRAGGVSSVGAQRNHPPIEMGGASYADEVWPCRKLGSGEDADPPKSRCALPRGFFVSGASVTASFAPRRLSQIGYLRRCTPSSVRRS